MNREDATAEKRMTVALAFSLAVILGVIAFTGYLGFIAWQILTHVFGG